MARDRKLSADERILWGKVARSTRPMPGKAGELTELDAFLAEAAAEQEKAEKQAPVSPMPLQPTAPATAKPSAGVHHPLEKPVKRKIAKGRLALEARIDLHGLVQSEAHAILLDFLIRAHERGMRHVLVITGKGSSMGSDGALKRAVPLWFSKPEFRYLISSYEAAAQHHGGEGALYIRLSRRHGERS
ncbi:DNA-nicking Smr family endonuclease [Rhizobium leguminosarum]|uniref:DNA-nicking Smr family endonuclease n=1 Tax=Rhizobium leguminosarum TaxID=384 RepID=A0AAE2ML29_RHILE|nr:MULTISPECIES: Smr/MutS family protein [Rhizobium]MBB4291573.1 DNA-nicking Smr family endonuclease [Rhizobium leguminosarum]MBB4298173.1 DNA-nicking Smr family endonuclease [Rhizobium leguminosarum]MBB4309311.1 DNA-nicking Smr family endonuclease [Rhizobium leguminosarum]MBB4418748.1 DNA-nicking Smr family endonuclease [Rhizobium leguminosarum]MBB4433921.1 DNA-nicking Smr family endonuclease [Rhizobium esperanzae]